MNFTKISQQITLSPDLASIILFALNKEYTEAFRAINELISITDNEEEINILSLMFMQILIMADCKKIASVFLADLHNKLKSGEIKNLSERTLRSIS